MPITIYTGTPGAGKTYRLAKQALYLYNRNAKYFLETKKIRPIVSNIQFSNEFEKKLSDPSYFFGKKFKNKAYARHIIDFKQRIVKDPIIKYWSDPRQLTELSDCDVLWDEIPAHLDATEWANMSLELKRWLQQHRKVGVEIYGTAQAYGQVDISARRLVTRLIYLKKIFGSRPPSATKPDPKTIWALGLARECCPITFDEKVHDYIDFLPTPFTITKKYCHIFDTTQLIEVGEYPPLKHIARRCEREDCNFYKVIHK